jgi:hypothetical protein
MPLMKSPAGDMEITISKVTAEEGKLITVGKLGAWDSKIYFTEEDIFEMIGLMLNWKVIRFLLSLPVLFIETKLKRNDKAKG